MFRFGYKMQDIFRHTYFFYLASKRVDKGSDLFRKFWGQYKEPLIFLLENWDNSNHKQFDKVITSWPDAYLIISMINLINNNNLWTSDLYYTYMLHRIGLLWHNYLFPGGYLLGKVFCDTRSVFVKNIWIRFDLLSIVW